VVAVARRETVSSWNQFGRGWIWTFHFERVAPLNTVLPAIALAEWLMPA
jgi:hypothetical protein